jgi:GDP-mannose 6-dehydrogenase
MTDIPTAEAVKYASNSWHALKIGFANEIGNFCSAAGVDGHRVMDAVCADRRLNISSAYMRPGMAFGGSCLPKDLRAIRQRATSLDVATPILDAVYSSNRQQIDRAVDLIARQGRRKVSMLGLSFKPGTDDLRESPLVEIAERLYGKGHDLRIFDRSVHNATLNGSNLSFIQDRLPHLADVLDADLTRVLAHGDVLVVGHALAEFSEAVRGLNPAKKVVDLVRLTPVAGRDSSNYVGLCWHA